MTGSTRCSCPQDFTITVVICQTISIEKLTTDNSPSQDYTHPEDQTILLHVTPRFKTFTVLLTSSALYLK